MAKTPAAKAGAHSDAHDDGHHGGGGGHDDHGGGGHCPPPWILTFADMATLLMAFFVLMLMTSKPDQPKFNAFAVSMRQTFGRVPLDPSEDTKGGTSILDLHFGPQSGEQTNEAPGNKPQSGDPAPQDPGAAGAGGDASGTAQDGVDQAAEKLAEVMRDAIAAGGLDVQSEEGSVTVRLPKGSSKADAQKIADAIAEAAGTTAEGQDAPGAGAATGESPDASTGTEMGTGPETGAETGAEAGTDTGTGSEAGTGAAAAQEGAAPPGAGANGTDPAATGAGEGTSGTASGADGAAGATGGGKSQIRAKLAGLQMSITLGEELASGTVDVEQRDGKVFVTMGAGGAFESGSADLSSEADALLQKLEQTVTRAKSIVVTGHTDNVPIEGGEFKDNWDLASARAASVVRAISESGALPGVDLVATSKGETAPIADNSTEEGRAKNRRIEIEIQFEDD
jgi:chemotaxis protein MotB